MAYLPIHKCIDCSNEIRKLFESSMKNIFNELNLSNNNIPTFSIGLAIVHHSYPLSKALELLERGDVRDAAEKAWSSIENMRKALLVAVKIPCDLAKNISTGVPLFIRILRALNRKDLLEK